MKHAIADIRFTEAWSALFCACGAEVHADEQERLNDAFQAHRVEEGQQRRTFNSSELSPQNPIRWADTITVDKAAEAQRRYAARHPERVAEQRRAWRQKNAERVRELGREAAKRYRERRREEAA